MTLVCGKVSVVILLGNNIRKIAVAQYWCHRIFMLAHLIFEHPTNRHDAIWDISTFNSFPRRSLLSLFKFVGIFFDICKPAHRCKPIVTSCLHPTIVLALGNPVVQEVEEVVITLSYGESSRNAGYW